MTTPANWRSIIRKFNALDTRVKAYFPHLPGLAEHYPWEVSISYLFARVELAHNMTIYCSVVKLHRVHTEVASVAVNNHHMSREGFKNLFENITGKSLREATMKKIASAEKVRDKLLHGKATPEGQKRQAVADILEYSEAFNDDVYAVCRLRPFGTLQGFKGRAQALDKSTSRWVLKGMGITCS